jgi:hypothetical protein
MQLNPSREDANCAATQELPSILWNPKVSFLSGPYPERTAYLVKYRGNFTFTLSVYGSAVLLLDLGQFFRFLIL